MTRTPPGTRADYRHFHVLTTRWMDNDAFRHVNNVNYFSYFDTAVTYFEMTHAGIDLLDGPLRCVVAEVQCRYHTSLAFPDNLSVGLRVARIGGSSIRYEIAVFREGEDVAAAEGYFIHVLVESDTQRPRTIPDAMRERLLKIAV